MAFFYAAQRSKKTQITKAQRPFQLAQGAESEVPGDWPTRASSLRGDESWRSCRTMAGK